MHRVRRVHQRPLSCLVPAGALLALPLPSRVSGCIHDKAGELVSQSFCFDGELFWSRFSGDVSCRLVFQNIASMRLSRSPVIDFVWNSLCSL